jgi:hypothetical protein
MPDWSNLSDWGWITPDLGIGAVVGSIITGTVALLVDQRRRLDESKNRFSEEKLRAYERIMSVLDVVGELLLLHAEFATLFRKVDRGEALSASDVKAQELLLERFQQIMERYDNHDGEETTLKFSLLSSGASAKASYRLMKVLMKMKVHVDAGNYEKVGKLALRYEYASASFLTAARWDLGIRN